MFLLCSLWGSQMLSIPFLSSFKEIHDHELTVMIIGGSPSAMPVQQQGASKFKVTFASQGKPKLTLKEWTCRCHFTDHLLTISSSLFLPREVEEELSWPYSLHRLFCGHALPGSHQVHEKFKCKIWCFELCLLIPTLDFSSAVRDAWAPWTLSQTPPVASASSLLTSLPGTAKGSCRSPPFCLLSIPSS